MRVFSNFIFLHVGVDQLEKADLIFLKSTSTCYLAH
jgi:hypothetical protein